jgi:hypothetical protein
MALLLSNLARALLARARIPRSTKDSSGKNLDISVSTVGMVPMMVLVWFALAAALVVVVAFGIRFKRRRDTPEELRGDWWPRFEAEFRAYARNSEMPGGRTRTRKGASRPSPPTPPRDIAEGSV